MKTKLLTIVIGFISFSVIAQPQVIIKQKAKDLRDANNAQQGVQQTAPKQIPQQPATQVATPKLTLSPQQENTISQMIGTLDKIEPSTQIDTMLISNIRKQLSSLIQIPVSIKSDTLDKLAEQLATIWQKQKLSEETAQTILKYTAFILNGRELASQSANALLFNIQKQLTSAGITSQDAQALVNTLKSVYSEIKK